MMLFLIIQKIFIYYLLNSYYLYKLTSWSKIRQFKYKRKRLQLLI